MTDDLQIWEQIDRYLSGTMTAKEQEFFKANMASDEQLAEMVEASQIANEVVVGHEVLKLKDQMSKDLQKPKTSGASFGVAILLLTSIVAGGAYFISTLQRPEEAARQSVLVQQQSLPSKDSSARQEAPRESNIQALKQEPAAPSVKGTTVAKNDVKTDKVVEKPTHGPTVVEATPDKQVASAPQTSIQGKKVEATPSKPNPTVEKTDACSGAIVLSLQTSPSCIGESTGSIHINNQTVTGGKAPYRFAIHADGDFSSGDITGLASGSYTLYIKDANACAYTYKHTATVAQIACRDAKKEFTYHLAHDPAWKIPYHADKTARSITITNKAGQDVYHSQVYNGSPEEWNGESNTGLQVSLGYHVYTIVYNDNTVDQGSIIIVK